MPELIFETLTDNNLEEVIDIECLCFPTPWSKYTFKIAMEDPRTLFKVAYLGEKVVGYGSIRWVLDEANLDSIGVHPNFRGKGMGDKILKALIEECQNRGLTLLTLEVRESNESAIKLYERNGFQIVGRRDDYYTSPTETALLMDCEIEI